MVAPVRYNGESLWQWYQRGPYDWYAPHWFFNVKTQRMEEIRWPSRIDPGTWVGLRPAEDVQ